MIKSVVSFLKIICTSLALSLAITAQGQPVNNTTYMQNPGVETPGTHRSVPIKLGGVDAVSGEINLQVPLGPRMPGRLPIGFVFSYDSQNGYHMQLGGDFRPVVWPDTAAKRLMYTVIVDGVHHNFARNFEVTNTINASSWMSEYSVDDGRQEAVDLAERLSANSTIQYQVGPFVPHVYQSMDGRSYFITSSWKICKVMDSSCTSTLFAGQRMMFLTEGQALWTDCKGTSHFQTPWGDHVIVQESGVTYDANFSSGAYNGGSIDIYYANDPSHHIWMTISSVSVFNNTASIQINNTFGLPSVSLNGTCHWRQRVNRDFIGSAGVFAIIWDYGFNPNTMTETADSQSVTTTFNWDRTGTNPYLTSIVHPNGLTESFTYGGTLNLNNLSDYSYNSDTGEWTGFSPNPNQSVIYIAAVPVVNQVVRQKSGDGTCIQFSRTLPAWQVIPGSVLWSQKNHVTLIKTYATPSPSGSWRGIKLTHPSYTYSGWNNYWGGPQAGSQEIMDAYLFATSAVVQADFIDTNGDTYKSVQYDDWSLRSYYNSSGDVFFTNPTNTQATVSIPIIPTATSATITAPGLPTQVNTMSNWDQYGYQTSTAYNQAGSWSVDNRTENSWNRGGWLNVLVNESDQFVEGNALPTLRSGAGTLVTLQKTSMVYDGMDRPTQISTTVGSTVKTENRSYSGTNPNPIQSTVSIGSYLLSGSVGKSYTYAYAPHYWLVTEKDILTKQTITHEPGSVMGWDNAVTDPYGVRTVIIHDGWGRIHQQTRQAKGTVGAMVTTYTYDPNGLWMTETVTGAGKTLVTKTHYDAFGREIKVEKPDGSWQSTSYNGWGEKVSQTPWIQAGQTNYGSYVWTYDPKGRVISETDPKSRTLMQAPTDPAWNVLQNGVVTTVIDDRGYSKSTIVDLLGQKRAIIDQKGQQANFTYGAMGRLIQTSFNGQVRTYGYTDLGWLKTRNEPEEGLTKYSNFTVLGQPTVVTKLGSGTDGLTITTTLDGNGRPVSVKSSDWTVRRTMTYNATFTDKLATVKDVQPWGIINESYSYDALGRRKSKTVSDEFGQSFSLSEQFDALGNVISLTYPAGGNQSAPRTVQYSYDAANRPLDVTLGARRGHMEYVGLGSLFVKTLTFGNNATTTSTMNSGELAQVTQVVGGATIQSQPMTWTAGGLLTSRGSDTFGYDELGRLKSALTHGLSSETMTQWFGYDPQGNRTSVKSTFSAGGSSASLPAQNEALTWTDTPDGMNRIPSTVQSPTGDLLTGATYDTYGRLAQVWAVPGDSTSLMNWSYDALGRVVAENGTRFLLDADGLRFRRSKADGNGQYQYQYVIYGFNRDPLCTFETAGFTPAPGAPAVPAKAKKVNP